MTGPAGFSLYQFFAPGGLLSKTHPAYEFRRGQLQMAQAVEEALEEKRHLIVEAGTGTGKTLAYLLPVIRSGKRVIISTGTKNLQEQLFFKDVPALERALFPEGDRKLSVCYMKGRNNYLCRKKLFDLTDQPVLSGLEEIEQYRAIAAWEKTTQSGDRAELAELPEASALWHKLDARADTCLGQKCKEWEHCFITEMRRRAAESDIIIVNHHLFFADLSIKLEAEGAPDAGVLPECAAVIFDEAHELEEVAGNYFGISVSNLRMDELTRDVERLLQREKAVHAADVGSDSVGAGALAAFLFAPARERRPVCLRLSPRVPGGKRRRISRPQSSALPAGRGTGATSAEAGGGLHAHASSAAVAGTTSLRDGKRGSQHRLLDRAARISWSAGRSRPAEIIRRQTARRTNECFSAGHSD